MTSNDIFLFLKKYLGLLLILSTKQKKIQFLKNINDQNRRESSINQLYNIVNIHAFVSFFEKFISFKKARTL